LYRHSIFSPSECVGQAIARGSQLKLQCLLVTTGDVIGGHYSRHNARWWRHQRSPAGIAARGLPSALACATRSARFKSRSFTVDSIVDIGGHSSQWNKNFCMSSDRWACQWEQRCTARPLCWQLWRLPSAQSFQEGDTWAASRRPVACEGSQSAAGLCCRSCSRSCIVHTELDMDWIHPVIGFGSGFSGKFMDWIGWDDCDPVL